MARNLSADIENEKNKSANKPIELYQVYLDEVTLYLANYAENIDFYDEAGNPQTYMAASLQRGSIETNVDTKVDECRVSIDNVDLTMSAYSNNTKFIGRKMVIWKVFREKLNSFDNKVVLFEGYMDAPNIEQHALSVNVVSNLDTLDKNIPGESYQVQCRFDFGGDGCEKSVPTKNSTIDSISGLTISDSNITEDVDYWKHGYITSNNETRYVKSSSTGSLEIEYPFEKTSAGDSYELRAGCDKTYDEGHGCTYWSNTDQYGGFLSIPKIRDVRNFD